MATYGADRTLRALGEIAVATRHWASLNPKAIHRTRLTFAEYFGSRVIAWPFKLLDCCVVTDAGGAVVVAARDRARIAAKPPISILGAAEAQTHSIISQMPNLTETAAVSTGRRAFRQAGITPSDIDLALLYDAFTYNVLVSLEDLGFCKKGEAPDFVVDQALAPGGRLPVNTNGGGLSYTHPGMYGIFLLIEAVRQLRGECGERQIRDCEVALVNGFGGMLSSASTIVLSK
jgi:acetyl-CoA acetyltransferase